MTARAPLVFGSDGVPQQLQANDTLLLTAGSLPRDGLKSRLTNGAMVLDQRYSGAAVTLGAGTGYTVDRWAMTAASGVSGQTAQRVSVMSGGVAYALRLARASGSTSTAAFSATQVLESYPNIDLQGQAVTLSFKAAAGANFSGIGLAVTIATGTGTDQGATAFAAGTGSGGWTGYAVAANATQALTTSFATYVLQATIPAGATQVGVSLGYTPSGTAGSADNVTITDVQLEVGSFTAAQVTFERRMTALENALCQRFYEIVPNLFNADVTSSTSYGAISDYAVDKRIAGVTFTSLSQAGTANGGFGTRSATANGTRSMTGTASSTRTGPSGGWTDMWGVSAEMT